MRSSPIAACEIDSNIEPLNLRREAAVVDMVERYRRSDKETPNRKIVDKWTPNEKIKQRSILKVEKKLQEKYPMPVNRETETVICSELPPNMTILTPTIKLGLIEEVSKRTTDPVDLTHIGIKPILSYPENTHQIYTDGSASKGSKNAGFGARIEYADKTCDEL